MHRYNTYGQITFKVAEQMRKPEVADFFAKLIQRTSPKSYAQAFGEVSVTTKFLENFGGDQVRCTPASVACTPTKWLGCTMTPMRSALPRLRSRRVDR